MRRALAALLLVGGCAAQATLPALDPGLDDLAVTALHPSLLLPSTTLDVLGAHFVDGDAGLTFALLHGTFTPDGSPPHAVDVALPAHYVDDGHVAVAPADGPWLTLGPASGSFFGTVAIAVDSAVDHARHVSPAVPASFRITPSLTPTVASVVAGALQVNGLVTVGGDGFLLGGTEGASHVVVSGCFLPATATGPCAQNGHLVTGVDVVAAPATPWDRTRLVFPFAPTIAGIHPGTFTGTLVVRNQPAGAMQRTTAPSTLAATLGPPSLGAFSPQHASLGEYVDIAGGGFVGDSPGAVTLVHLVGTFSVAGGGARPVDLELLPHFVDGNHLRYVIDEADELGHAVDLRKVAGTFTGTAAPIVRLGPDEQDGAPSPATLGLDPVKQVVEVRFAPSYRSSLRLYGLAAADAEVRARILAVAARDYLGVNLDWRTTDVTDYALYSVVDIVGPDPNDAGLFGYDNTPGKDVGNARLYDHIGGVNAATQQDGFPGYGGIFADEFIAFSQHPPSSVAPIDIASPAFDAIFDPLRPDTGRPATADEAMAAPVLTDGSSCPASDRAGQVACAIYVLGNLIGTTLTHEVGHSLGLANPYGDHYHDTGDLPDRLMEAGGDRPFEERAEIGGQGPGRFCDTELTYLQAILPGAPTPAPSEYRPPCTP